jgi:hypothetical protein
MKNNCLFILLFGLITTEVLSLPFCEGRFSPSWNNCFGEQTYSNGAKYTGQWKNMKEDGKGYFTYPDGSSLTGEFKDGNPVNASLVYATGESKGDKFEGDFVNWKFEGQGTYTWTNGNKYVGEWKNGKANGNGTITYSNGKPVKGIWKDSELVRVVRYFPKTDKVDDGIVYTSVVAHKDTDNGLYLIGNSKQNGTSYYIETHTVKVHNGEVYYWRLNDYLRPNPTGSLSQKIYSVGDCELYRTSLLTVIDYGEPMGRGVGDSGSLDIDWHYPVSGSGTIMDKILDNVCAIEFLISVGEW